MNQQINLVQAQAMLDSLQQQLTQACTNIAARDGVLAVQAEKIKELEAKLVELQPKEQEDGTAN